MNLINYFQVHYTSIILLQKPILYYHNISIFKYLDMSNHIFNTIINVIL
jgi:hypothetical protein